MGWGGDVHVLRTCTHELHRAMFDVTEQVGLGWGEDVHVLRTCTHELHSAMFDVTEQVGLGQACKNLLR